MSDRNAPLYYIGCRLSLMSKAKLRYEGTLAGIDTEKCTVELHNVQSFGTENRCPENKIPPTPGTYDLIIFNGHDLDDLKVIPKDEPIEQQDPAIINAPKKTSKNEKAKEAASRSQGAGLLGPGPNKAGSSKGQGGPASGAVPGAAVGGPTVGAVGQPSSSATALPGQNTAQRLGNHDVNRSAFQKPNNERDADAGREKTHPSGGRRRDHQNNSTSSSNNNAPHANFGRINMPAGQHQRRPGAGMNKPTQQQRDQTEAARQSARQAQLEKQRKLREEKEKKQKEDLEKYKSELDFDSLNAKFDKDSIAKELEQKLNIGGKDKKEKTRKKSEKSDDGEEVVGGALNADSKNEENADGEKNPDTLEDGEIRESQSDSDSLNEAPKNYYEPKKSFFDNISCEANDPKGERLPRYQERKLNAETFGIPERPRRNFNNNYRGMNNRRGYNRSGPTATGYRPRTTGGYTSNNTQHNSSNNNTNPGGQTSGNRGYYYNNNNSNNNQNQNNHNRNTSGPRMGGQQPRPLGYGGAPQNMGGYMSRQGHGSSGQMGPIGSGGLGYGGNRGYNKVR